MITEDYVSFEVAKLLQEKGFNVPITSAYIRHDLLLGEPHKPSIHVYPFNAAANWNADANNYELSAPTHQMALKWLREVHNIKVLPAANMDKPGKCMDSFCCLIYKDNMFVKTLYEEAYSYEEAVETALKYCLTELIK